MAVEDQASSWDESAGAHGAPSPCRGVCALDAEGVCTGCGRTISEIAAWPRLADVERRAVAARAARRLTTGARDGE